MSRAAVDRFGNARGGVPSPLLNAPIACYEAHSVPGPLCALAGRETPLPIEVLTSRYGDPATYLAEFVISLADTIRAGFLWDGDRDGLLDAQRAAATTAFAPATHPAAAPQAAP